MTYETLLVELTDGVAVITINRPEKRNALNAVVRRELIEALHALAHDAAVRVVVLTGAGDKAFVAGADVAEFAERSVAEQRAVMTSPSVFDAVAAHPRPVLAMVNGYALGGGCELALACDLRIAAESAKFGQPEIKLGLIPGGGGTQRLPRLVGAGMAFRMIVTGELIDAREAHRMGLVDEVCADASLRERSMQLAHAIAAQAPAAVSFAKQALHAARELPLAEGLSNERELFLGAFGTDDKQEGLSAFFEKRAPAWKGR